MTKFTKLIGVGILALAGLFSALPSGAQDQQAAKLDVNLGGVWQADNGESRYALELCGDGTQLCAKLTWIQPNKINDRNKQYIDQLVVDHANLVQKDPMTWAGDINVYGNKVSGRVTLVNSDRFTVRGCAFFIFCEETGANRVKG